MICVIVLLMCHCYISYCENQRFLFGISFVAGGDICATVEACGISVRPRVACI
jgi:hypothetical protein